MKNKLITLQIVFLFICLLSFIVMYYNTTSYTYPSSEDMGIVAKGKTFYMKYPGVLAFVSLLISTIVFFIYRKRLKS